MGRELVLGLGNCVDYEAAWDSAVVEQLITEYGIQPREVVGKRCIATARDLVISILGFLETGTGGEQFVASPDILHAVADRFEKIVTVGGTPMRAAIAMHRLGHAPALHLVAMNAHVRKRIPGGCEWVCSAEEEALYPHLIIQFPEGARVRAGDISIRAPRANRIIYVNDPDNDRMALSPQLADLSSGARVLLVSGLNAMRDSALLADRLVQLREVLASLPRDAIVFYEDAAFHDPALGTQVREALVERIDIYSLNEDELQAHLGRPVALLDPADVLAAMRELRRRIPVPILVAHTSHWAMAYGTGASRLGAPLKAGITMACTRMRLGDEFGPQDLLDTESMSAPGESATFAAAINAVGREAVCCSPSFALNAGSATTIGLGDAFVGGFLPMLLGAQTA